MPLLPPKETILSGFIDEHRISCPEEVFPATTGRWINEMAFDPPFPRETFMTLAKQKYIELRKTPDGWVYRMTMKATNYKNRYFK